MNRVIAIVVLLFCGLLQSFGQNVYYVSTTGNDSNPGTISQPWATWQKGFDEAEAGDTVYFRGGTYRPASKTGTAVATINPTTGHGNSGTYSSPICFFNYPGEVPILDGQDAASAEYGNIGIVIQDATYIKLRGLTVINNQMRNTTDNCGGISVAGPSEGGNFYFENVTVAYNGGAGLWCRGYDTVYVINCDSHHNCDSLDLTSPGGDGDGFALSSRGAAADTFKLTVVSGCRSWANSDDGFDIGSTKQIDFGNNWAFNNGGNPGYYGDGVGLKLSYSHVLDQSKRRVYNNIFACNRSGSGTQGSGMAEVNLYDETVFGPIAEVYNNFIYNNLGGFASSDSWSTYSPSYYKDIFTNNIIHEWTSEYQATFKAADYTNGDPSYAILTTNTFVLTGNYGNCVSNPSFAVSDADFISLDTLQLSYDRKPDGSLPDIDFGKLAPTSDLIDAGTDVGLDYYGDAPDLGPWEYSPGPQIIADHTVIDDFDYIPQYYIDEVKKMMLGYIGESHAAGFRTALTLLEADDATYQAEVGWFPTSQTSSYLRAFGAFWGDVDHATGWQYGLGEEDWYWSSTGISRIKSGLTYINDNIDNVDAFGFGWCWDPDETAVDMPDYIEATKEYVDYCIAEGYDTKVFFSTGPVDGSNASGEIGYNKYLAYEVIRDSVLADTTRILFDFADILCYDDDAETPNTTTWDGHTYPIITTTNLGDESIGHIGEAGALRLAKAMWWMLARMAGWDGNVTVYSEEEVDSTATDILTFVLAEQTGAATINITNHTVAIEVAYTADVTDLTPTITLSYGATVIPTSGVARDFTNPVPYTVTAEDGVTYQEWTVTVTQEAEPVTPVPTGGSIVKFNGKIVKR